MPNCNKLLQPHPSMLVDDLRLSGLFGVYQLRMTMKRRETTPKWHVGETEQCNTTYDTYTVCYNTEAMIHHLHPPHSTSYFIFALPLYVAIACSNSSLHGTLEPRRAHNKNAPLSLRCRLYVSSGGGARRSRTMTGIKSRTRSVIVWSLKS